MAGLLEGYRIIDLADEKGLFCGCLLGELGAQVIKVEKPGGDPGRNLGPFYHDTPDPQKSLFWCSNNDGKQSITLNLETAKGRHILEKLIAVADFVVESFKPGYLDRIGLGYDALSRVNPGVILISITPFGQTGPFSRYKASDMCCIAMGGIMSDTGDEDRPPVRISSDQAYLFGGMHGAIGALLALNCRQQTGKGQHVDIAIRDAIIRLQQEGMPSWEYSGVVHKRHGRLRRFGKSMVRELWECKDGYVAYRFLGGLAGKKQIDLLLQWMEREKVPGTDKATRIVEKFGGMDPNKMTQSDIDSIEAGIAALFLRHTKAELYAEAIETGIPLSPLNDTAQVLADEQLKSRNFWAEIEHAEFGASLTYPGFLWQSSETYSGVKHRAPLMGEHNHEIYSGLGLSEGELRVLKEEGII